MRKSLCFLSFEAWIMTLLLTLPGSLAAQDELRYALVIGNKEYPKEIGTLQNPVNDAIAMAEELRKTNFEVQLVTNATYEQIREAVRIFFEKLNMGPREKIVGLFYYAGHGVQYHGENYIVPVDAKVQYEDDIVRMCFPIQRMVLSNMERAKTRMNILILDACRNNPFPTTTRSMGGGLTEMKTAYGSFVAYATAPGAVASDGMEKNGLYTQELLKAMQIPGLLIEQVFKEVRRNVLRLSGEKQYTWDSSNIIGDFYFIPSHSNPMPKTNPSQKDSAQVVSAPINSKPNRTVHKEVISNDALQKELADLTNNSVSFNKRQAKSKEILSYFVVPYATVNIMMNNRIDERLTASRLLDRMVTLPASAVKVLAVETSDSGRIIELSIEIDEKL